MCFITSTGGRETFLGGRIPFRPGRVVDTTGATVGEVGAIEMITIGQRRGIGLPGGGPKRYVVDVDVPGAVVVVGDEADLARTDLIANDVTWTDQPYEGRVRVQCSAHGATTGATIDTGAAPSQVRVVWGHPQRRVAPGQSVVFYDESDRRVLGGGTAAP